MAGHNHQGESMVDHLQIPDAMYDERSPHRHSIHSHDIDLSDTVANFVDFVKEGRHTRHRYRHNMHTRYRGNCKTLICSFHLQMVLIFWQAHGQLHQVQCVHHRQATEENRMLAIVMAPQVFNNALAHPVHPNRKQIILEVCSKQQICLTKTRRFK